MFEAALLREDRTVCCSSLSGLFRVCFGTWALTTSESYGPDGQGARERERERVYAGIARPRRAKSMRCRAQCPDSTKQHTSRGHSPAAGPATPTAANWSHPSPLHDNRACDGGSGGGGGGRGGRGGRPHVKCAKSHPGIEAAPNSADSLRISCRGLCTAVSELHRSPHSAFPCFLCGTRPDSGGSPKASQKRTPSAPRPPRFPVSRPPQRLPVEVPPKRRYSPSPTKGEGRRYAALWWASPCAFFGSERRPLGDGHPPRTGRCPGLWPSSTTEAPVTHLRTRASIPGLHVHAHVHSPVYSRLLLFLAMCRPERCAGGSCVFC